MMVLEKLFAAADKYLKKCKWTDIALLKFCVCSIGIFIGMSLPKKKKNTARILSSIVFTATYVPLMTKFLPFLIEEFEDTGNN